MIFEHTYNNYHNNYKIVNDCRTLRALKNRNYINSYDKKHKYIDCSFKQQLNHNIEYKNNIYKIKYFDGCFSPFVIQIINKGIIK